MTDTIAPFYDNGVIYELTINFDDNHQLFGKGNRDGLFRAKVPPLVKDILDNSAHYCLYPEISMPQHVNKTSSQPRIHYHGIIVFYDMYAFLLTGLYSLGRFSDVQFNHYRPNYWKDYCKKSNHLFKKLPGIRNCTYDTVLSKQAKPEEQQK